MADGKILIADQSGHFLLKLVGDVRVTLCVSLNDYMQKIFADKQVNSVTVDVTTAETIDSTTLGMLTRMAQRLTGDTRLLMLCADKDMVRLLASMGLTQMFKFSETANECQQQLINSSNSLSTKHTSESATKPHIIDAHKALMELNDNNKEAFRDLVKVLEADE